MNWRRVVAVTAAILTTSIAAVVVSQEPAPSFRSGVDLVTIEAQVVDRGGRPVLGLGPDDFDVAMGGIRRRVVIAEMVRLGRGAPPPTRAAPSRPPGEATAAPTDAKAGRQFYLAFDNLSFDVGLSAGVARVAQEFVRALEPEDTVGLFSYPVGSWVEASNDHAAIIDQLARVRGQKTQPGGRFNLRGSDVIDYAARPGSDEARAIVASYCTSSPGPTRPGAATPVDPTCATQVGLELGSTAALWEGQARISLEMLAGFFGRLREVPGRKVVVLFSAGTPTSDRPGGRPDIGELPADVGRAAARSNAVLYSVFIDRALLAGVSAENRLAARTLTNLGRDAQVATGWLDRTTSVAGGTLLKDLVGTGDTPVRRILDETSVVYVLGIERGPAKGDALIDVRVTVKRPGATVRARRWAMAE